MIYRVQVIREVQQSVTIEVNVPNNVIGTVDGWKPPTEAWVKGKAEDHASEISDNDWRDEESVIDENQTSILGTDEEETA
jgi:hypothetical protein